MSVVHMNLIPSKFSCHVHPIYTQVKLHFLVTIYTVNCCYLIGQFGKIATFARSSQKCLNTELMLL